MLINLKTYAAINEQQSLMIEIQDRLPGHLCSPCLINCLFKVKPFKNYYLITLKCDSILTVVCQRCLGEFAHHYSNQTELAICDSDETAENMMSDYECIVSNSQVNLQELLTDELYLYAPQFHLDFKDCDHETDVFISVNAE
jgi:uncharacterized protein